MACSVKRPNPFDDGESLSSSLKRLHCSSSPTRMESSVSSRSSPETGSSSHAASSHTGPRGSGQNSPFPELSKDDLSQRIVSELRKLQHRINTSTRKNDLQQPDTSQQKDTPPTFNASQVKYVCAKLLKERENEVRAEYDKVLNARLAEQYETFVRFAQDQIHSQQSRTGEPSFYQRPLLCELARDPSLGLKQDPPPSPYQSSEFDEKSQKIQESQKSCAMFHSEPSHSPSIHSESRHRTRVPSVHESRKEASRNNDLDSETGHHSSCTNSARNSRRQSTDRRLREENYQNQNGSTKYEFRNQNGEYRNQNGATKEDYRNRNDVRKGNFCKIHGFVPATGRSIESSHNSKTNKSDSKGQIAFNGSVFEESEEDEDYSYAQSYLENHANYQHLTICKVRQFSRSSKWESDHDDIS